MLVVGHIIDDAKDARKGATVKEEGESVLEDHVRQPVAFDVKSGAVGGGGGISFYVVLKFITIEKPMPISDIINPSSKYQRGLNDFLRPKQLKRQFHFCVFSFLKEVYSFRCAN